MLLKSVTHILYNFDTVPTLQHMLKSVLNHFLSCIEKGQWYSFLQINVRENRRDKQEWTIQRMQQLLVHNIQDDDKQNKNHNTIRVGHHYTQTNTNNVNKT